MLKKLLIIAAVPVFVISCKKDTAVEQRTVSDSVTAITDTVAAIPVDTLQQTAAFQLGKFGFPPEVEGCSCYFAENKSDFEKEQFVYVDDYGNNATIRINGENVKIRMDDGDFDPSNFSKSIENEAYLLEMTGKKIDDGDETMLFQGTMKVTDKNTRVVIMTPIYGECGC